VIKFLCFLYFVCLVVIIAILNSSQGTASRTFGVQEPRECPLMTFTNFDWEDVMARLDYLVTQLRTNPQSKAAIFVYGGESGSVPEEVNARMRCMEKYLTVRKGVEADRIRLSDGGYRETATIEFWLTLEGTSKPYATPTVPKTRVHFNDARTKDLSMLCDN
jgi:hypothetical protein